MFLSNSNKTKFQEPYTSFSAKPKSFETGKNIAIASSGDKKIEIKLLDTKRQLNKEWKCTIKRMEGLAREKKYNSFWTRKTKNGNWARGNEIVRKFKGREWKLSKSSAREWIDCIQKSQSELEICLSDGK